MCKSDGLRPGELDCHAYCIFKTATQVKSSIIAETVILPEETVQKQVKKVWSLLLQFHIFW